MLRTAALSLALVISATPWLAAQLPDGQTGHPRFSLGAELGYHSGLGVEIHGILSEFAPGFPLRARLGIQYASVGPGEPLDARRIFINNVTNGTPKKSGRTWGFKLDLLHPVSVLSLPRSHVFGGVRSARFTGNFLFVGGNEDFDIRSSHWGFGGGLESYFTVSSRVDMVVSTGVDYFFSSTGVADSTSTAISSRAIGTVMKRWRGSSLSRITPPFPGTSMED